MDQPPDGEAPESPQVPGGGRRAPGREGARVRGRGDGGDGGARGGGGGGQGGAGARVGGGKTPVGAVFLGFSFFLGLGEYFLRKGQGEERVEGT